MLYILHPRDTVIDNINRMLNCGDSAHGGAGNITPWRIVKHFDYTFLRNFFRKVLLDRMAKHIGSSFKKVKNEMYTKHSNGFYVCAKPNSCTPDITIKYITRYLGRPVIAASHIDKYDGNHVTFHYNRHENGVLMTETIPVLDFIKRLIVNIPEKHFKMLRYYGFMQNITSKRKILGNAFPMKNIGSYDPYLIGTIHSSNLWI